jgi:hypothetical protein
MTSDGFDGSRRTRSPLRDEEIERLLSRFFQQEMPADLCDRAPTAVLIPSVEKPCHSSLGRSLTVACLALALFGATWGISSPDASRLSSVGGTNLTGHVDDGGAPIERFEMDPEHAPVERRASDRTTNVTAEDPDSRPRLESDFPELTIEIVPIPTRPTKPVPQRD